MRVNLTLLLATICSFLFLDIAAQDPAEEFRLYKEKFPSDPLVNLLTEKRLEIKVSGDELDITYSTVKENIYLNDNARQFSEDKVSHSSFRVLNDWEAYTLTPSKRRYKKEKVEDYTVSDFGHQQVFYDDSKETTFVYPLLDKGGKTHLHAEYQITDPHMLPLLFAATYAPIEKAVFSIVHDQNVEIEVKTINTESLNLTLEEYEKRGAIYKIWTFKNIPKLEYASGAPAALYFAPQILVRVKKFQANGKTVQILGELEDLHSWYCDFISQTQEDDIEEIKYLADSITKGIDNKVDKVVRIYDWVKGNINYIAIEDGYNGYIPQKASVVCNNRYGDCKGMSNLLYLMLQSQNIEAHLAWVGTRELPYKYTENPAPTTDNHMIAVFPNDSSNYFLDPTHPNLPFGLPSPFIQGKQVMINKGCESFDIAEVRTVDPAENLIKDSCNVKIDGNTLRGSGLVELKGFSRMSFMDRVGKGSYSDLKAFCRNYLVKGNNNFILDTVSMSNAEEPEQPLILRYEFHIPNYVLNIESESFVNLNLDKVNVPSKFPDDREVPFEVRFKNRQEEIVVLETAPDEHIDKIPDSTNFSHSKFSFSNIYNQGDGILERRMTYDNNYLLLEKEHFPNWNQYVDDVLSAHSNQVIISKTDKSITE